MIVLSKQLNKSLINQVLVGSRRAYSKLPGIVRKGIGNSIKPRIRKTARSVGNFEPFPFQADQHNIQELLKRRTSPLSDLPYEEQLKFKENHFRYLLASIGRDLYRNHSSVRLDVNQLPCKVGPIIKSPELKYYQNKLSADLWQGYDGLTPTVGKFIFPLNVHGNSVVAEPNNIIGLHPNTVKLTDILQVFVRTKTILPTHKTYGKIVGWKNFKIRNNRCGDLMLVGALYPADFTIQQIQDEQENFRDFLISQSNEIGLPLKSLYVSLRVTAQSFRYQLIHGESSLVEKINNLNFSINPQTVFYSNVYAADEIEKTARALLERHFGFTRDNPVKPMIIDPNCYKLPLSLQLADLASKVIGMGSIQNCEDARMSSSLNNISNSEFFNIHPGVFIEKNLNDHVGVDTRALIVTSDLSWTFAQRVRDCEYIQQMLLLGTNVSHEKLQKGLLNVLCGSSASTIPPFEIKEAVPIDSEPHEEGYSSLMVLARSD